MQNEIVLVITLILIYSGIVVFYRFLGKTGLYMWTVIATIAANIEVLILVNAFGMEQTLGNVLFASTFLVTDILSELEDRQSANRAVHFGIIASISFILISQSWFLYIPNSSDWAMPYLHAIFSNTPRLMLVGIAVYAIAQLFDVWLYHLIWNKTSKIFGNSKKGLWIRNNCSTLLSQLLNTALFTFGAFAGVYDFSTLLNILVSSYVIFIATSLLDTPAIYIARKLKTK
ncbi:queuosine precursor transporter [Candidatus Epulonipiscium viviparus]|uniref:queuosine precursor transporter n=1 Tax=Candidatus Epulonipiscium viviparus TaxID=420336 RepID=UPI0027381033|nr:queuosine precursor transporter [Candidatus Epulopiscium viviparus]